MQQLTQKLKDGLMQILEVSPPVLMAGQVLVQNHYSLISSGTEVSTVKAARSSLIAKARQRPQQVKQVIDTLKSQGVVQTYRAVMKKLDAYSPLGYSCVGRVIDVSGSGVDGIRKGDWVACGGATACHAEVVGVPEKLCVKLKADTDLQQAAYNTLGAIAMQGVRQADLRLGETCAVIGLGLLGQLTSLLLKASGIRVIGVDIDEAMVSMAGEHCLNLALNRGQAGIEGFIGDFTGWVGCDAVIITAATDSLDPINFAGSISRKRGTVVVVGAVPTGFDREPHFYKKELQIRMSCSYGPGRYDPFYEEKGVDYPVSYVRWTEKRNMEAFQELIYTRKIDVSYLTTHRFSLDNAPEAYDMLMAKAEPFVGLLIEYDHKKERKEGPLHINGPSENQRPVHALSARRDAGQGYIGVGFIGAGSYAQSHLLPNIESKQNVFLKGVVTTSGTSSRSVAERHGFEFCTSNVNDIIEHDEINTIFIATRHESHAGFVLKALRAGKNVFVEKPLCLKEEELGTIASCVAHDTDPVRPVLMVGYNRRFSPFAGKVKNMVQSGPASMIYRVNAGAIPSDSWIQDRDIGGGRIIGEVCHFVDFLTYVSGSLPVSVYADALNDTRNSQDSLTVTLRYENGSIGSVSYFANGDKSMPKEMVEVYAHGSTAVIDDFKILQVYAGGKKNTKKLLSQDKGQKNEIKSFLEAIPEGRAPIPYGELFNSSWVTFKILESIATGRLVDLV